MTPLPSISPAPTIPVTPHSGVERLGDYFSQQPWQEPDIQRSWMYARKHKDSIFNGRRLENVSWRRWFQEKFHLQRMKPEELNWARRPDECWLYGPIFSPDTTNPQPTTNPDAQFSPSPQPTLYPFLDHLNLIDGVHAHPPSLRFTQSRRDLKLQLTGASKSEPEVSLPNAEPCPTSMDFSHPSSYHVEHLITPMPHSDVHSPPTRTFASSAGPSGAVSSIPSASPTSHMHHKRTQPLRKSKSTRDLAAAGVTRRVSRRSHLRQGSGAGNGGQDCGDTRRVQSEVSVGMLRHMDKGADNKSMTTAGSPSLGVIPVGTTEPKRVHFPTQTETAPTVSSTPPAEPFRRGRIVLPDDEDDDSGDEGMVIRPKHTSIRSARSSAASIMAGAPSGVAAKATTSDGMSLDGESDHDSRVPDVAMSGGRSVSDVPVASPIPIPAVGRGPEVYRV